MTDQFIPRTRGRLIPTPRKKTLKQLAQDAGTSGISPLEVMLDNMRFAYNKAIAAYRELLLLDPKTPDYAIQAEGFMRQCITMRNAAGEYAKDAAPYVHPKLASIEYKPLDEKDIAPPDINLFFVAPEKKSLNGITNGTGANGTTKH